MNILQQQEALKDMSESQLVQEAKRPSGSVPSYMVLSELNRRKDMRQRYQLNQTKPNATVAEEVITQTEQGIGSMMPRRQSQQMAARPQMPMQQSAIAQNQPMRMQQGGVIKMQAGGDPSALSDEQLRQAIAAIQSAGAMTAVQQDNLLRLQDELDVRNQITQNVMASNAQANQERREALEGFIEDPLSSIGSALAGNPNLRAPSLRETSLAREQLKAEQSAALAQGMEEGRVGSTDPTPLETQAEAEETIEQILATDPSLADDSVMQAPGMVQQFPGGPMIPGQQAPNVTSLAPDRSESMAQAASPEAQALRQERSGLMRDPEMMSPEEEAQLYAETYPEGELTPQAPEGGGGGISGLPLPLLLEAARFGADIAERGTRGENLLGSIAGAGKTSIDRGIKTIDRQAKQKQLEDLANLKNRRERENILFREQVKKALETPETASVSELNTAINSLNDQLLSPELDELEKDRIRAQIADLRRMMQSRVGLAQGPTQNLSTEAQAIIDQRTQPAS